MLKNFYRLFDEHVMPTAPAGCSFLTVEWLKEMGWTTWSMPWEGWNNTHGERTLKNSALKDGLCFREWNLPAREPLQVTSITEVGKYHAASLDNRICLGEGICVQADEDHGCYSGYISSGSNWKMNPRNQCTKYCLTSTWTKAFICMHTHVQHEGPNKLQLVKTHDEYM